MLGLVDKPRQDLATVKTFGEFKGFWCSAVKNLLLQCNIKGTVSRDFLINFFVLITKSVLFVKPLIIVKFFCKSFVW